LPQTKLQKVRV